MPPDVYTALAGCLNALVTLGAAAIVNWARPALRASHPVLMYLFTPMFGVLAGLIQTQVATWTGFPIDLSPWVAAFTGAAAVALHQGYAVAVPEPGLRALRVSGQTTRW